MLFPLFLFVTTGSPFVMSHPAREGAAMESGHAVTVEYISYHIWSCLYDEQI